MKHLIFFIAISIIIAGCNKDDGNIKPQSGIVIKGSIPNSETLSSYLREGQVLSLSDATQVLVFNLGRYYICDITDGSFSISPEWGTAIALLFLDANNQYIGNLSSQGLNLLPLGNLTDSSNTVIDLSTLTLDGTTVIPSHDPLGNEIIISEEEINILKAVGQYYESIAKNIDANNDGVPDILNQTQIRLSSGFSFLNCGHWGHKDAVPVINNSTEMVVYYGVGITGGDSLSFTNNNITFSGPAGDPYNDITIFEPRVYPNAGFYASAKRIETGMPLDTIHGPKWLPFKKGTYTLRLDDRSYTLDYANNNAYSSLVLAVPTLNINSESYLTSISLEYKLINGSLVNPANILTNVYSQIAAGDDRGTIRKNYDIYNSPIACLSVKTGFDAIVPVSPIYIPEKIQKVLIWYQDLIGNDYALVWE